MSKILRLKYQFKLPKTSKIMNTNNKISKILKCSLQHLAQVPLDESTLQDWQQYLTGEQENSELLYQRLCHHPAFRNAADAQDALYLLEGAAFATQHLALEDGKSLDSWLLEKKKATYPYLEQLKKYPIE